MTSLQRALGAEQTWPRVKEIIKWMMLIQYIYIYTPRNVEAKNVPTRNGVVYKVLGPVITIPK